MKKIEAEGGESLASFFGRFHDVLPNLTPALPATRWGQRNHLPSHAPRSRHEKDDDSAPSGQKYVTECHGIGVTKRGDWTV